MLLKTQTQPNHLNNQPPSFISFCGNTTNQKLKLSFRQHGNHFLLQPDIMFFFIFYCVYCCQTIHQTVEQLKQSSSCQPSVKPAKKITKDSKGSQTFRILFPEKRAAATVFEAGDGHPINMKLQKNFSSSKIINPPTPLWFVLQNLCLLLLSFHFALIFLTGFDRTKNFA